MANKRLVILWERLQTADGLSMLRIMSSETEKEIWLSAPDCGCRWGSEKARRIIERMDETHRWQFRRAPLFDNGWSGYRRQQEWVFWLARVLRVSTPKSSLRRLRELLAAKVQRLYATYGCLHVADWREQDPLVRWDLQQMPVEPARACVIIQTDLFET